MQFKGTIMIRLKRGHSDPEGETATQSLRDLRYSVQEVRVAKIYEIIFTATTQELAEQHVEEMCKRLLANPVKDDYTYKIQEIG
jgi:phosphoribosylformylglycinamidine synthase PurS subunit